MSRKHLTNDQIQRMIASDPEAPEATAEQLAQARPFTEAFTALSDAMRRNVGGRPKTENPSSLYPASGLGRVTLLKGSRSKLADQGEPSCAREAAGL